MAIPEFTSHQIGLLIGSIAPRTTAEDEFIQDHANDVIPGYQEQSGKASPPPPPGIDQLPPPGVQSGSLLNSRPMFVPPTFIARSADELEKKNG